MKASQSCGTERTPHSASTYLFGLVIGVDFIFDGASLLGFGIAIHSLPEVRRKAA